MTEMGPNRDEGRVEFAKDAMARDLRDFYGISYDEAMQLVEDMHEKARRAKETFQEGTEETKED